MAQSNWISPSKTKSGFLSCKIFTASRTRKIFSSLSPPEPLVEKESIATIGSTPAKVRQLIAAEQAMSANCSELGVGITAQSEKIKTPFAPSLGFLCPSKSKKKRFSFPEEFR